MRNLILISAFVLVSAAAQAGQSRGLVVAANDTPAETRAAETKRQATAPANKAHAHRYESDEAKASCIAARYGIYWKSCGHSWRNGGPIRSATVTQRDGDQFSVPPFTSSASAPLPIQIPPKPT